MQDDILIEKINAAVSRAIQEALPKALAIMPQVRPEYLPTEDAATYVGLSPFQLEQWRSHGDGPRYVKLSRAVRYPRSALDDFMMAHLRDHTA